MIDNNLPLLIYDSECTMCQRFQQGLALLDKNKEIHYASVHDESIYQRFTMLNPEQCRQTVHLVVSKKEVLKGHEVVEHLIEIIPGVKKFAWLLDSEQGKKAVEFFYNKVNQIKQKSKGCSHCKK